MILKLQQGGTAIPPLVSYQPVMLTGQAGTAASTASDSDDKSGSDLTDKDLITMLDKLDGLPNDMQAITSALQNFYIDKQYSTLPDTTSIASRYLGILQQMKVANFNKKRYDEAFDIVKANGGINEVAINEHGQLVCVNSEGDFKFLKPEQLSENSGYVPVTNSELLRLRAYNPEMINNTNILGVVQNGIGIDTVTKQVTELVSKLGTQETSQEGYAITQQGQVITGLQDLTQAIKQASQSGVKFDGTTQDLYQYKFLNKSQKESADLALGYIYGLLPENAKSLLKTKTSTGTDADAQKLIATIIASQIDYTNHYDVTLKAGKTAQSVGKSTNAGTTKDGTEQETSLLHNIMQSIGGSSDQMIIDIGNGVQMSVAGTYYQQITKPNGDPIMDTSIDQMLADSKLQSIIKSGNAITYGDQKITREQLKNITYNNTGVLRANLPINTDGTPNLQILQQYEQVENEIALLGQNPSPDQISAIYEKYGLKDLLKADGTPNPNKFGAFIVTEGYTTENNGIKKSPFVKHVKEPSEEQIDLIKRSLTTGTSKDKQTPDIDTWDWYNPMDWVFGAEDIFKASIYIPISNNQLSAVTGANQHIDYDEAMTLEQKYQNFEKNINQQTTNADVLGL